MKVATSLYVALAALSVIYRLSQHLPRSPVATDKANYAWNHFYRIAIG